MKKTIVIAGATVILLVMTYTLVTNYLQGAVQEQLTQNYPEIDNVLTINRIGSWGEWFSEYALVVEVGDEVLRIWVNDAGEIVEQEVLSNE